MGKKAIKNTLRNRSLDKWQTQWANVNITRRKDMQFVPNREVRQMMVRHGQFNILGIVEEDNSRRITEAIDQRLHVWPRITNRDAINHDENINFGGSRETIPGPDADWQVAEGMVFWS